MNIDELIKESIDEATTGRVPTPDLERIHQQGRRRSVVQVGGAALATVAVVAAGTYALQGIDATNGQDELPASIRAQGPAMAFKTFDPVRAQFAGKTFEPEHKTTLETSAMTGAGLIYVSGDSNGTPYLMDHSGEETQLGDPVNPEHKRSWGSQIITDGARGTAAWSADVPGPEIQINMFDADSRKVTDSITFDPATVVEGSDASLMVAFLTIHDGIVYGTIDTRDYPQSFAWDPSLPKGRQIYTTTDPNTVISTVGNDRLVLKGSGNAYGGPDEEPLGPSVRVSRLPGKSPYKGVGLQSETLSPDGQWALVDPDVVNDDGVQVGGPDPDKANDPSEDYAALNLDTGKMLRLRSQGIWQATFDDDGSVLMIELTPDGGHQLVDCALPSQKCTTVMDDLPGKASNTSFIE